MPCLYYYSFISMSMNVFVGIPRQRSSERLIRGTTLGTNNGQIQNFNSKFASETRQACLYLFLNVNPSGSRLIAQLINCPIV